MKKVLSHQGTCPKKGQVVTVQGSAKEGEDVDFINQAQQVLAIGRVVDSRPGEYSVRVQSSIWSDKPGVE